MMLNAVVFSLALAAQASTVSVQYDGPLKEALRQIADKGGLNVVVASSLNEQVQVHLSEMPPEEALMTLAKVYELDVTHEGKMWVVRSKAPHGGLAVVPPLPPAGAAPLIAPEDLPQRTDAEDVRDSAERARDEAEAARERAQELRDQAREMVDARREEAEARREEAKASAEEAKARVQAERDVVATGGPMVVKSGTTVDSAISYGGPVIIESNATVEGDAVSFGGNVVIEDNAVVEGNAVSLGGRVVKHGNARVGGEVVSVGSVPFGKELANKFSRAHSRHGHNNQSDDTEGDARPAEESNAKSPGSSIGSFFAWFATLFGLGFVLMMFAPQRMRLVESSIRQAPVKNGIIGFLSLLAVIPASLIVAITIIGIPVVLLGWVCVVVAMVAGVSIAGNVIGGLIHTGRLRRTQAMVLALGVLVVMLAWQIPFLGPVLLALAVMVSLGAMVTTKLGQPPRGLAMPDTSTFSSAPA